MTIHDIFRDLSNRMVGAMMIHTQLTELFSYLDLIGDAERQKKQFYEESTGLIKLEEYYTQHHHMIITSTNPPNIDILRVGMMQSPTSELTPSDKVYLLKYAMNEWIKWERESKIAYEDAYHNLIDISEVAAAEFVSKYVKDVDEELKTAEFLYRTRDAINWDLPTIYDGQMQELKIARKEISKLFP